MSPIQPTVRESTLQTIGDTPMVRLRKVVGPQSADVLVKLEYLTPPDPTRTGWRWHS